MRTTTTRFLATSRTVGALWTAGALVALAGCGYETHGVEPGVFEREAPAAPSAHVGADGGGDIETEPTEPEPTEPEPSEPEPSEPACDGGVPIPPILPATGACWSAPIGDVDVPSGDIIGGCVVVDGGDLDVRIRFADHPFPNDRTLQFSFCFDTDDDRTTGAGCGSGSGAESAATFWWLPGHDAIEITAGQEYGERYGLDCSQIRYSEETHELQFRLPRAWIGDTDGSFTYGVSLAGGGGPWDEVPAASRLDSSIPWFSPAPAAEPFDGNGFTPAPTEERPYDCRR